MLRKYSEINYHDNLEVWPFEGVDSAYQILKGNPVASGRIDEGGSGHTTRLGIWACTCGTFACTEQGDEMMTIVAGAGSITDVESAATTEFVAGDTLFSRHGRRVIWDITEKVTKIFFGHKNSGF